MEKIASEYIYDWAGEANYPPIELQDETLRDGLQAPYVVHPTIEQKLYLLHLMEKIGLEGADIGYPGSGERHLRDVIELSKNKLSNGYKIKLSCAGRTTKEDIFPIIQASEAAGEPLEADLFIGSSEIRKIVQEWDLDDMKKKVWDSVTLAVQNGLPVMFVTEDTTRAYPQTLLQLYRTGLEAGASRICLCDTVGIATPLHTRNLIAFTRNQIIGDKKIKLDWHGHRDTGLDIANGLEAAMCGVDRIHGTALGVGERAGNALMHLLVANFNRLGISHYKAQYLEEYSTFASTILQIPIPVNEPIVGREAFNTASGVHAAAIFKARQRGLLDLANTVYSPYNPRIVGRDVDIRIGPMSGKANVELVLEKLGLTSNEELVERILQYAKNSGHILTDKEVRRMVESL